MENGMQEMSAEHLEEVRRDIEAAFNNAVARMWGTSEPRWRFFETDDGWMFCWNTEPMDHAGDGRTARWRSWIYRPYGRGAQSGNPQQWKMIRMAGHATRNKAKMRADRLYKERGRELAEREAPQTSGLQALLP